MAKSTTQSKETISAQSEAVFGAVLPEDDWPFAAFPPLGRLAVVAGQPSEPGRSLWKGTASYVYVRRHGETDFGLRLTSKSVFLSYHRLLARTH
jgi:hypothetical protein